MPFKHNSTGVEPSSSFTPIPEGQYVAVITDATEKTSKKNGWPMVETVLTIIENTEYHGRTLKHYVVFIPAGEKGDGMNVHFRKCIGVPYGGEDEVDARNWLHKKIRIKLKIEERDYEGKHYTGNKVAAVFPYGEDFPPVEMHDDEITF